MEEIRAHAKAHGPVIKHVELGRQVGADEE
jgi:hypothetical protein